ncbi:hypothetical protein JW823_03225 [bacterium]|nr:hypothetical protein [candidate division CSSED10-310 bacterium]
MDFPMVDSDLEQKLLETHNHEILPVRVKEEQIILCIGRAYALFNHPMPPVQAVRKEILPFYIFCHSGEICLLPAAGFPFRLIQSYQFKVSQTESHGEFQSDFTDRSPDVPLESALERLDKTFADHPSNTRAGIIRIPFYIVSIGWGKITVPLLINAYNADVLLENPPVKRNRGETRRSLWIAVGAYLGLVSAITAVWISTGSMVLGCVAAVVSGAGIRWITMKRVAGL